jgi:hypothetical protein
MVADSVSITQVIEATETLLMKWSQNKALPLNA